MYSSTYIFIETNYFSVYTSKITFVMLYYTKTEKVV